MQRTSATWSLAFPLLSSFENMHGTAYDSMQTLYVTPRWAHVVSISAPSQTPSPGLQRDVKQHGSHRCETQLLSLCHVGSCRSMQHDETHWFNGQSGGAEAESGSSCSLCRKNLAHLCERVTQVSNLVCSMRAHPKEVLSSTITLPLNNVQVFRPLH